MTVNEKLFLYVIVFLGTALLGCVGGIIFLVATDHAVPDILQNVVSAVVAGLIGLLATPKQTTP